MLIICLLIASLTMNLLLSTFWEGTEAQTETLTSKSFRNTANLTDVKKERTDGQLFGWRAGRKADKALLWLESQIFVNAWDAGMCVHGLKILSPKQTKVFLIICFCFTPFVLLLCLISHLRISQSWNSPFFLHSMKIEGKKRKQTASHRY